MPALRKEIAEGIVAAIQPFAETIVALQGQVEAMKAEKEKADDDAEDAETKELEETPLASVAEYVRKASAIGKEETKVDGRTTLAKGPTQAEPIQEGGTFGIPFIDSMVSGKEAEVEG
jgi:hypothetical protein